MMQEEGRSGWIVIQEVDHGENQIPTSCMACVTQRFSTSFSNSAASTLFHMLVSVFRTE